MLASVWSNVRSTLRISDGTSSMHQPSRKNVAYPIQTTSGGLACGWLDALGRGCWVTSASARPPCWRPG